MILFIKLKSSKHHDQGRRGDGPLLPNTHPKHHFPPLLVKNSPFFPIKSFSQGQPPLSHTSRDAHHFPPLSQFVSKHRNQPHTLSYNLPAQGAEMTTVSAIFFEISAKIRPKNVFWRPPTVLETKWWTRSHTQHTTTHQQWRICTRDPMDSAGEAAKNHEELQTKMAAIFEPSRDPACAENDASIRKWCWYIPVRGKLFKNMRRLHPYIKYHSKACGNT